MLANDEQVLFREKIIAHLQEILVSPSFKSSTRSKQFLEYVVLHSLDNHPELLKERLIGEKIFNRPVDYDTGQDSIVRVKANEVRKRLAQYYDHHPSSPVRLDLPSGSYVIQFRETEHKHQPEETEEAIPAQSGKKNPSATLKSFLWVVPLLITAGVGLGWLLFRSTSPARTPTSFDHFWQPILESRENPIICLPTPEVFRIYGSNRDLLVNTFRPRSLEIPVNNLPDVRSLQRIIIVPETGLFLGIGDAQAVGMVQALSISRGKNPSIRQSNITTFAELRTAPSIMIGGMTNRWAMYMIEKARFTYYSEPNHISIRDTSSGKDICVKPPTWESPSVEDCAIVTRIIDSKTGHPILIAAGLDHYGTLAVGEFITQPRLFQQVLKDLPSGWEKKNMQIVFRVEKVRDSVGPPKDLMVHVW